MRKAGLYMICIVSLFVSCSKKGMVIAPPAEQVRHDTTYGPQIITWTQGDPIINGTYNIFSMGTNEVLEIPDGATGISKPGLNAFNNHYFQRWDISNAGEGYFEIENNGSGKVLAAVNSNSTALEQTAYTGADGQLWKIQHRKLGLYSIINKATGLAITLDNNAPGNTQVVQSAYSGAGKQLMAITLEDYAQATDSVTIDFSSVTDSMKHVASGFLHGFSGNATPPDSLLLPLKINTVRDWIFDYALRGPRLNALGYKQQLVISDGFAQPYGANGPPGNNGDWTSWENTVAGTVTQALALVPGNKLQYDVWNEPDGPYFWGFTGTYAFPGWFFETWKHAYIKARSIDPGAVMVGPSYSSYNEANLEAFLLYCKTNNCLPNYLSWHFPTDPVSEVAEMDQFMADNDIHIDGIIINEYTLSTQQTAGKTAYLIAQLERARVAAAMHAIWGSTGSGQLDGIVGPASDGNQKMATWWVYKAYGDLTGKIVKTTPSANIELVAAMNDDPRMLNVLMGNRAKVGEGLIKVKFLNVTPLITNNQTKIHFKLQRIPDSLYLNAVTTRVPTVYDLDVNITYGSSMTLLINWKSEYDAYAFKAETLEQ